MSTLYHAIVDCDAGAEEALALGRELLAWLAGEGIIEAGVEDCVLGDEGGHRPGPRHAAALADPAESWFLELRTNGVQAQVGRRASCSSTGAFRCAVCPACRGELPQDEVWSDAAMDWHEGGAGMLRCTHCGQAAPITQWDHVDPMGFGELTFTFWNWPTLSEDFLAAFKARLGHRTVVISAML